MLHFANGVLIDDMAHVHEQINGEKICLGNVVICLSEAQRQANAYMHTIQREVAFLFVHSLLHLLGFDHLTPEDEEKMHTIAEIVLEKEGYTR